MTCFEVIKLSEEHGQLKRIPGVVPPKLGDLIRILPNHSCPIANLADELVVLGQSINTQWKVIARGCSK